MSFQVKNWTRVSSSGNTNVVTLQDGTLQGAPTIFCYISGTDTIATIAGADYFAQQANELNVTDLIYCVGTDTQEFLTVAGVTLGPPRSVITVVSTGVGNVDGPASSTNNALVRWSGTTGRIIKNGTIIEDDSGNLTLVNSIANAVGTAAVPTYTFTGRTNTGVYSSAANTFDITTDGTRQVSFGGAIVAVNYHLFQGSAGTSAVLWSAQGTSANLDMYATAKGTGTFNIRGNTNAGTLTLWNQANTFATSFKAAAVAQSDVYTLPTGFPPVNGYILSSTTGGVTSWVSSETGAWVDQTTTPVTIVANTSYSANNAGLVTLNMPATASFGDIFEVAGQGAGGWLLKMNTGQIANLNSSATSSAGSLASTNRANCVKLLCTVANTTFTVIHSSGNITVA
jgi:hypothetical protein